MIGVGIDDELNGVEWKVYPNPGNGIFQINAEGLEGQEVNLNLTDIRGRALTGFNFPVRDRALHERIDVSNLAEGIYLLHLRTDTQAGTIKLVVQR